MDSVNWVSVGQAANWVLSLGVFAAIVTATLTSVREKASRDRNHRSSLANQFLERLVSALSLRLSPTAVGDDQRDAQLVFSTQMMLTELNGRRNRQLRNYVEGVVRQVRFGQPRPAVDETVTEIAPIIAAWVLRPHEARERVRVMDGSSRIARLKRALTKVASAAQLRFARKK